MGAATNHVSPFRHILHWKGHRRHELQDTRPTPLQAVPQARPRLERPPIPLARTGPVHPRTLRGQAQCYRAATDEGTDQGDGKPAREVEAPRPLPPTHGSWRIKVRAQPALPNHRSSTEDDFVVGDIGTSMVSRVHITAIVRLNSSSQQEAK